MAGTEFYGVGGTGQVGLLINGFLGLKCLLEAVDLVLSQVLELIQLLSYLTLLLIGHVTEIGHEVIYGAFLA